LKKKKEEMFPEKVRLIYTLTGSPVNSHHERWGGGTRKRKQIVRAVGPLGSINLYRGKAQLWYLGRKVGRNTVRKRTHFPGYATGCYFNKISRSS